MNTHCWVCAGLVVLCSCAHAQKGEPRTHWELPGSRIDVPDRPTHEHVTPGSNRSFGEFGDSSSKPGPAEGSSSQPVKPKPPPGEITVTPLLPSDGEIIVNFPRDVGPTPEHLRQIEQERARAERKRQRDAAIADQKRRDRIVDQRNDDALHAHSEYARVYSDPFSSPREKWNAFLRWQEADRRAAEPVD